MSASIRQIKREVLVIDAIRAALKRVEHYKEFGDRIRPALRVELAKLDTGPWSIQLDTSRTTGLRELIVWRAEFLEEEHKIHLVWHASAEGQGVGWLGAIRRRLDLLDRSDYLERAEQEALLHEKLAELSQGVDSLRQQARMLIEELPVPSKATVRRTSQYWKQPSSDLTKEFPNLFS